LRLAVSGIQVTRAIYDYLAVPNDKNEYVPELADKIMHGTLETDPGFTLMGADLPPGTAHNPGDNIAVSLSGDDADALRGYWEKLSENGTVSVPLEKQMWGDEFGMCVDPFGINWMVNVSQA